MRDYYLYTWTDTDTAISVQFLSERAPEPEDFCHETLTLIVTHESNRRQRARRFDDRRTGY